MARKEKKGRKVRVEFRQNRAARGRGEEWTRRFQRDADATIDARLHESVRPKGDLSRKRTVMMGENDAPLLDESQWRRGVCTAVFGLVCRVNDEHGATWDCTVRRVLRTLLIEQRSPVTVGDRVWFSAGATAGAAGGAEGDAPGSGVIERVEERRTRLSRRERRGREHTLVANADQLLIVASIVQPRLKPHLIDRYIVAAHRGGLRPLIALNKADLGLSDDASSEANCVTDEHDAEPLEAPFESAEQLDEEGVDDECVDSDDECVESEDTAQGEDGAEADWADEGIDAEDEPRSGRRVTVGEVVAEYRALGYRVVLTSAATGMGVEELRELMRDRVTVLSGQSGVGKSSLINAIQPGLELAVGDVSEENQKGRHTTSHARLLPLSFGGFVVDTPGVRAFDLWDMPAGELEAYFIEIAPRVANCAFSNCTHLHEDGCAVLEALDSGEISPRRYDSFAKMYSEAAQRRRW
ncbi:MAG: ribosome small subunit-dependent GTPase A [Phycisphaerales bacterium]|nr:ribosome small subunit-dependent GTPase A [Phycisphaerales bacterium]